jgi:pyruvate/2-oxoglutarate dehydrogenase complex dihydrolipoamide dehydrogenase (E3) component
MPTDNTSPGQPIDCDVCVIGAGSGGLSVAAGAARLGVKVVLVEKGKMGGDCLNTGCVPSKSLIAAAHHAEAYKAGLAFGVGTGAAASIDFARVQDYIDEVKATLAPADSVERFEGLGVRVIKAAAVFSGRSEVMAGGHHIRARRFVVATGSRATVPDIDGLRDAEPLTNESIFDLRTLPRHLAIIGGGPIGMEMAQAFCRLGSKVTVLDRSAIMPRDEPEARELVRSVLSREGVEILEGSVIRAVRKAGEDTIVDYELAGEPGSLTSSHLLVAAGRTPNIDGLGLDKAGVAHSPRGIEVDARLRSTNRKVYAIGDVAGGPEFTHIAGYHAGIVVRNILFNLPARVNYSALPWVTYLDPEIAHVGLTEAEAVKRYGEVEIIVRNLAENDRANTERRTEGFVKLVLSKRGRVLGVTIAAPNAGEMIGMWGLVITRRVPLSAIASMILPYPTMAEIAKRAASAFYEPKLFGALPRAVVGLVKNLLP